LSRSRVLSWRCCSGKAAEGRPARPAAAAAAAIVEWRAGSCSSAAGTLPSFCLPASLPAGQPRITLCSRCVAAKAEFAFLYSFFILGGTPPPPPWLALPACIAHPAAVTCPTCPCLALYGPSLACDQLPASECYRLEARTSWTPAPRISAAQLGCQTLLRPSRCRCSLPTATHERCPAWRRPTTAFWGIRVIKRQLYRAQRGEGEGTARRQSRGAGACRAALAPSGQNPVILT
jgi:hypothetical protein